MIRLVTLFHVRMRLLISLAIPLFGLAALLVDVAEGCETTLASATPEEEEVASGTTEGAITSVETGSVSTEAPRHGRNNVQFALKHTGEDDGSSSQNGAVMFSDAGDGNKVGRGIKSVVGLLRGAGLRATAGF